MLIVAGSITIDPASRERVAVIAAAMMKATSAEPANLEYVFSFDAADPGSMQVFELWESEEGLSAHFATPHMAEFRTALGEIGTRGMAVAKYQVSSSGPVFGD